ncbi:MAG TPA: OmpH family outer membrane protein [Bacteroidia bacterium]|nr:OmpH family outer membrane protein [Bacteroidia bacterium]
MKNLSLALNFVLLLAVAILYYLHFTSNTVVSAKSAATVKKDTLVTLPVKPTEIKASDIVYVNIDTLDAQYQYILDNSKQIHARQSALEGEYARMTQTFQKEYDDFNKSAQAGALSGEALEKVKVQLEAEQNAIAEKQNQIRGLEMEVQRKQGDMLKKLADFLARYNSTAHYRYILPYSGNLTSVLFARNDMDITNDVIQGLNAEYKLSKQKK